MVKEADFFGGLSDAAQKVRRPGSKRLKFVDDAERLSVVAPLYLLYRLSLVGIHLLRCELLEPA